MVSVNSYYKQTGMTLLELLVAVALLSVIAVMAYASIYTLVESKQQMDDVVVQLNQEASAIGLFNEDIKMAIGQTSNVNPANTSKFIGEPQSLRLQRFNPYQSVPRQGLTNQLKQQPATVLEVRWFVRDSIWYRASRSALSPTYASWQEQAMLPLRQIRCQYQTIAGQLLDRWPAPQAQTAGLPRAVHCRLTSEHNRHSDMVITPWQQIW